MSNLRYVVNTVLLADENENGQFSRTSRKNKQNADLKLTRSKCSVISIYIGQKHYLSRINIILDIDFKDSTYL
jgi:hypothetical protein